MAPTPALIQLVEQLEQMGVHAIDGLEEGEHGRVVGDAAASHVVALHAVDKGGDSVLQSLQKLCVVLLRLPILVLLLGHNGVQLGITEHPLSRTTLSRGLGSTPCTNLPCQALSTELLCISGLILSVALQRGMLSNPFYKRGN